MNRGFNYIYRKKEDLVLSNKEVFSKGTTLEINSLLEYLKNTNSLLKKYDLCKGDVLELGIPSNGLLEFYLYSSDVPLYNDQYEISGVIEETEELKEYYNIFRELVNIDAVKLVIKVGSGDKPQSTLYQSQISQDYYVVYRDGTCKDIVREWEDSVAALKDLSSKEVDEGLEDIKNIEEAANILESINSQEMKEPDLGISEETEDAEEKVEVATEIEEASKDADEESKENDEGVQEESSEEVEEVSDEADKHIDIHGEEQEEVSEEQEDVSEEPDVENTEQGYGDEAEEISESIILPKNISSYLVREFLKVHEKIFGLVDIETLKFYLESYKEDSSFYLQMGCGSSYISLEFNKGLDLISMVSDGLQFSLSIYKVATTVGNFIENTYNMLDGLNSLEISIDGAVWSRGVAFRNVTLRENKTTCGYEIEIV